MMSDTYAASKHFLDSQGWLLDAAVLSQEMRRTENPILSFTLSY
jgi:hypothetical protein